jgi:hypothetical protein
LISANAIACMDIVGEKTSRKQKTLEKSKNGFENNIFTYETKLPWLGYSSTILFEFELN